MEREKPCQWTHSTKNQLIQSSGKKNSFDIYSAREYLELFYPENPSATAAAAAAATATAASAATSPTPKTSTANKPPLRRSSSTTAPVSNHSLTSTSWHFLPNAAVVKNDLRRLRDNFENHGMLNNKEIARLRTLVKRS